MNNQNAELSNSSKVVQVSNNEFYLIGGQSGFCTFRFKRNNEVQRSCIRVDIDSGIVTERAQMTGSVDKFIKRFAFGACRIGHFIYVVFARTNQPKRYDILKDQW